MQGTVSSPRRAESCRGDVLWRERRGRKLRQGLGLGLGRGSRGAGGRDAGGQGAGGQGAGGQGAGSRL
ncbi:hypothetical protein SAMN05421543_12524 [Alicyclobacillus macrosporangiidus]|uniref:Uncharacterized protein n=1 Tax=Alicyclobacillus macrosporangiidus TaxID=392015 RepID=A0A1I7L534_9BACL|nr:hypothetical protein SAMN05421543_12524 [Alicyclobacillus macrosporangiidus]